jgi:hypothetical protein
MGFSSSALAVRAARERDQTGWRFHGRAGPPCGQLLICGQHAAKPDERSDDGQVACLALFTTQHRRKHRYAMFGERPRRIQATSPT